MRVSIVLLYVSTAFMVDVACRGAESWLPQVATYGYWKLRLSDAEL